MWDDLNSNPWQVGNWLANWVGRLCRSWSWLQQWIGQCHRKPRKRSRSWSCRLIHRRSWDQNNGWRCTSRCILMIWFRFRCSWSTQSHPPLTQLSSSSSSNLFKPLEQWLSPPGDEDIRPDFVRPVDNLLSPSDGCHAKSTVVVKVSVSDQCVKQWHNIYSRRHKQADSNLLRHCLPALCSSWTLRYRCSTTLSESIGIGDLDLWRRRPLRGMQQRSDSAIGLLVQSLLDRKNACYWQTECDSFFSNAFAIRVCFRDTKNTKATILWMVWRNTVRRTLG